MSAAYGAFVALRDVAVSVEAGMVYGLIGPNGAGKSTLIDVISGFHRPTNGTVTFGSVDLTRRRPHTIARLGIRRTFQHPRLLANHTVTDNVATGLIGSQVEPRRRKERTQEVLERLDLRDIASMPAKAIDGVSQLKVQIARCLVADPRVILLDEPSAGMDDYQRDDLVLLLADLSSAGVSVVLVAHDLSLIRRAATKVGVIDTGTRIAEGPTDEVLDDGHVRAVYLGVA